MWTRWTMANNRLWLKDTETGDKVFLAKAYDGWSLCDAEPIDRFLRDHDMCGATGGKSSLVLEFEEEWPDEVEGEE